MKRLLPVAALAAGTRAACRRTVRDVLPDGARAESAPGRACSIQGIVILGAPPFLILAGFIAFVFAKDKVGQDRESHSDNYVKSDVKSDVAW